MDIRLSPGLIEAFEDSFQTDVSTQNLSRFKRNPTDRTILNGKQSFQTLAIGRDDGPHHAVSGRPRQLGSVDLYTFVGARP